MSTGKRRTRKPGRPKKPKSSRQGDRLFLSLTADEMRRLRTVARKEDLPTATVARRLLLAALAERDEQ